MFVNLGKWLTRRDVWATLIPDGRDERKRGGNEVTKHQDLIFRGQTAIEQALCRHALAEWSENEKVCWDCGYVVTDYEGE